MGDYHVARLIRTHQATGIPVLPIPVPLVPADPEFEQVDLRVIDVLDRPAELSETQQELIGIASPVTADAVDT
jgi:hypothetical protein